MAMFDASAAPTSYADIAQLQQRRANTPENLKAAAEQFEALLADVWIRSMRAATDALGGGLVDSHALGVHQEMLDHQWAVHMAENGGLGIADVIVRQLQRGMPAGDVARPAATAAQFDALPRLPVRIRAHASPPVAATPLAVQAYMKETTRGTTVAAPAHGQSAAPAGANAPAAAGSRPDARQPLFATPRAFVRAVLPVVREVVAPLGLDPLAVAAQAALETGWGQAVIAGADGGSSHNLFGIKAGDNWQGPTSEVLSGEFVAGSMQPLAASFRAYANVRESVEDLVALLHTGARYAGVLAAGTDANGYAEALQASGYATDPDYAAKIRRVLASPWLRQP